MEQGTGALRSHVDIDPDEIGSFLEHHEAFTRGVNVQVAEVLAPAEMLRPPRRLAEPPPMRAATVGETLTRRSLRRKP